MRGLKILVVVMGVLLVAGTGALVAAIIYRVNHRTAAPQQAALPAPAGRGFGRAVIDLPAGAKVLSVDGSGERLVIRLALAEGGEAVILVDPRTGARLGTIELRPGAGHGEGRP